MNNRGRTALVTGGAGGIGTAIVRRLVESDHRVAIAYSSNGARAEKLAVALTDQGATVRSLRCDASDRQSVAAAFDEIESAWEPVTVLINNGGIRIVGPIARMDPDDFERVVAVNLTGAFNTTQRALPGMVDVRWGRIVNISSPTGHLPMLGSGAYGTAKAGLELMTKVLALEVARKRITVNVVSPGYVKTEMTEAISGEAIQEIMDGQATDRPVEPDEIGAMVQFLVSDDAEMVSGQVIDVDGGGQLVVRFPKRKPS